MPTRILRDWTDSATIEPLSAEAERLFIRLIMRADDFGRYHADARLVTAGCLPLVRQVTVNLVDAWLNDLQKAGLIIIYFANDGRKYLQINKFGQRTRANHSKFPEPSRSNDGQVSDKCLTDDGHPRSESESESETKSDAETVHTGKFSEALKAFHACHPDCASVPDIQVINTLRSFPQPKWLPAIEAMGRHYAGASMRKPVGHLENYLAGKQTGNGVKKPKEYINA